MEKIIENDSVTLTVYPEKKIVYHEVHGFIQGDSFQELFLKGAQAFKKHRCNKWLSDDRKSTALRKEDLEWAQQNWEPDIIKAGWKYWALILPEAIFGKMNMKELIKRYDSQGIEVQVFTSADEGMKWLESK